jgi:predicted nucleotidyltransferase
MINLKEILRYLNTHKVKFVIIGGMAAVAQGSSYLTRDLDICYARNRENLENLVKALSPFNPRLRGAQKNLPFIFDAKTLHMGMNFTLSTDAGDIDLIGEVSGIGDYEEVIKYSEKLEIYGMQCNILTLEGLIKNKKAMKREKDKMLLVELETLLHLRKTKK